MSRPASPSGSSTASSFSSLSIPSPSPSPARRSRSFSLSASPSSSGLALPPLRIVTPSAAANSSESFPSFPKAPPSPRSEQGLIQQRNLLAHILTQLAQRDTPPSLFERYRGGGSGKAGGDRQGRGLVEKFKEARGRGRGEEVRWWTDGTTDLVGALFDVLLLAHKRGWKLFASSEHSHSLLSPLSPTPTSPFRLRRRSSLGSASPTRPSFPSSSNLTGSSLLNQTISLLASIALHDCRYTQRSLRLSRPPHALHLAVLDVALVLSRGVSDDPRVQQRIGEALLPGFAVWPAPTHGRLMAFFEGALLRRMLDSLRRARGLGTGSERETMFDAAPSSLGAPSIAIHADEPPSRPGWVRFSPTSPSFPHLPANTTVSTLAPALPLHIYHLASLVPPLLSALLEHFDPARADTPTLHALHRLLIAIISTKQDAYLDFLAVAAYSASPAARRNALSLLTTYYPASVGRLSVVPPLPHLTFPSSNDPTPPQYLPWRFPSRPSRRRSSTASLHPAGPACAACARPIAEFALLDARSHAALELDCFGEDGHSAWTMTYEAESGNQRFGLVRFADVPSCLSPLPAPAPAPPAPPSGKHAFQPVTLFTLTLCFVCRRPLWGTTQQALKCSDCRRFCHASCASTASPSCKRLSLALAHLEISWPALRADFLDAHRPLVWKEDALAQQTWETVAVAHGVLWTQLRLLEAGIAAGCLVVKAGGGESQAPPDEFELQHLVRLYSAYLESGRLRKSPAFAAFARSSPARDAQDFMFSWPVLTYITALLKAPPPPTPAPQADDSEHLQVEQSAFFSSPFPSPSSPSGPAAPEVPYETLPFPALLEALSRDLGIAPSVGAYLLEHLLSLGLLARLDGRPSFFPLSPPLPPNVRCAFSLPLAMDDAPAAESLVGAVEAALEDLDLAVNETGLLLLTRRAWPTAFVQASKLDRLVGAVLRWVFDEDDKLHTIAQRYITQLRPGHSPLTSPNPQQPNSSAGGGGGDQYVASRRRLVEHYVRPWLAAVHDAEADVFGELVFAVAAERALEKDGEKGRAEHAEDAGEMGLERKVNLADGMLRNIIKLVQAELVFSSFDAILCSWLDEMLALASAGQNITFRSLPRLFNGREGGGSYANRSIAYAFAEDPDTHADLLLEHSLDPWRVILETSALDALSLQRGLRWLRLLAQSGVAIASATLSQLAELVLAFAPPFETVLDLVQSGFFAAWLRPMGKRELVSLVAEAYKSQLDVVQFELVEGRDLEVVFKFVQRCLGTILLVCGCPAEELLVMGFATEAEVASVQKGRKVSRTSIAPTPIEIDGDLISLLALQTEMPSPALRALIGSFFRALFVSSSFVNLPDQLIARNSDALMAAVWHLFESEAAFTPARAQLFTRVLPVDPQALKRLLDGIWTSRDWQLRHAAVQRLFDIIGELKDPELLNVEVDWRPHIAPAVYRFFGACRDDREEVRQLADVLVRALLPAHVTLLSSCFEAQHEQATIDERLELCSFITQVQPLLPEWQVLSWVTLLDALFEMQYELNNDGASAVGKALLNPDTSVKTSPSERDPKIEQLWLHLISITLQQVSAGHPVDLVTLLKLKYHLACVYFDAVQMRPSSEGAALHIKFEQPSAPSDLALGCLVALKQVLDCSSHIELSAAAFGGYDAEAAVASRHLTGAVFVDLVFGIVPALDLAALPYLVCRNWLEAVLVIVYKHDLQSPIFRRRALQDGLVKTLSKVADLVLANSISVENRQLAITISTTFLTRVPDLAPSVLSRQVLTLSQLVSQLQDDPEGHLCQQAIAFLQSAFARFALRGVFVLLFKGSPDPRASDSAFDISVVLERVLVSKERQTDEGVQLLHAMVVQDVLHHIHRETHAKGTFSHILRSLRHYIERVYPRGWSNSLQKELASWCEHVARSLGYGFAGEVDADPLLSICATVVENHRGEGSKAVLHSVEALLRSSLVHANVSASMLMRVLRLYLTASAQHAPDADSPFALAVIETLSDALRGRTAVQPKTLQAMLEVYASGTGSSKYRALECIDFLRGNERADSRYLAAGFDTFVAAAKLFLDSAESEPALLQDYFFQARQPPSQTTPSPLSNVRLLNWLHLGALYVSSSRPSRTLLQHAERASAVLGLSLRFSSAFLKDEHAAARIAESVNQALALVKLALLVYRRAALPGEGLEGVVHDGAAAKDEETLAGEQFWNGFWPPFRVLLVESVDADGNLPPLASSIWLCFADVVLFLHALRSPLVNSQATELVNCLQMLRVFSKSEGTTKFHRALQCFSEPPPSVSTETLLAQAKTDLQAAIKLRQLRG